MGEGRGEGGEATGKGEGRGRWMGGVNNKHFQKSE